MKKRCDNLYDVKRSTTCNETAIYMTYEGRPSNSKQKKIETVFIMYKIFSSI